MNLIEIHPIIIGIVIIVIMIVMIVMVVNQMNLIVILEDIILVDIEMRVIIMMII